MTKHDKHSEHLMQQIAEICCDEMIEDHHKEQLVELFDESLPMDSRPEFFNEVFLPTVVEQLWDNWSLQDIVSMKELLGVEGKIWIWFAVDLPPE